MGTTLPFPNLKATQEASANWLAAIDRGLAEEERQKLNEWLAQSPINGEVLLSLAASWDKLDKLRAIAGILPLNAVAPSKPQWARRSVKHAIPPFLLCMALICLACALSLLVFFMA